VQRVVRLLLLANPGGTENGERWSLVPIAGNETTDDDVNPPASLPCMPPTLWSGERENRITDVFTDSYNIFIISLKPNMKETWESG
jgi:hypothetical protein